MTIAVKTARESGFEKFEVAIATVAVSRCIGCNLLEDDDWMKAKDTNYSEAKGFC